MNRDTAITQQILNMTDQIGPYGNITHEQTGTTGFRDAQGNWIETPRFTQTTTLSPEQDRIRKQSEQASLNLASLANQQSEFLGGYLGKGLDTSSLTGLQSQIGGPFNSNFSGQVGGSYNANFNNSIGGNYNTDFSGGIGGGFDTNFNRNIGGSYAEYLGDDYRRNVDLATSYAGADDFSADRKRYEDALWDRQAGDRQQNQDRLRTQLINSGIRPGTAAFDSEMARLSAAESDSRLATLLAGGQEQQRMVGLARDAAMFGNDANLNMANFGNNAISNQFSLQNNASLNRANFAAEQQARQNAAALAQAQFGREGQQLGNAASLGQAQFGREGQQLGNAASLGQAQFGSSQQQLGNQSAAQEAAFNNQARAQGMQEQFAQRNQPINEISALMSGGQVTMPSFGQTPQTGVAGVDYTGLVNQKYQSELQSSQAAMGGLFGLGSSLLGMLPFSDRRLKEDIKRVGQTDAGVPVYTYRYKNDDVVYMGVMAQDVPEARVMDPSGYYRVDYRKVS